MAPGAVIRTALTALKKDTVRAGTLYLVSRAAPCQNLTFSSEYSASYTQAQSVYQSFFWMEHLHANGPGRISMPR